LRRTASGGDSQVEPELAAEYPGDLAIWQEAGKSVLHVEYAQ